LLSPFPAAAQTGFDGLCALFLQQERTELEDLELAVELDETRLAVAQEIFVLVDGLWQNDLFERLPYLGVKHRRDVAEISLERAHRRLDRQRAVVEQYRLACSGTAVQDPAAEGDADMEDLRLRYVEADCAVRALDVAAFETDLTYYQEVLRGARDLRLNDIASRQQVLFAEQDVQVTLDQLDQARQRTARCGQ
jgi:hypothetical protein